MHSEKFTVEDLILDPSFVKWVKEPEAEDGKSWIEWSSYSIENSRIVEEAKEIVLELAKDDDAPVQQELSELWTRISASNALFDQEEHKNRKTKPIGFIHSWQRIAAVLAFIILSSAAVLFLSNSTKHQTAYGENKRVVLPDGSAVVLNANSSVRYSANWDSEEPREVWLDGEGFFSVTHKSNAQKFIVHTNELDVQVLGTMFNVNARRGKTRVILNSGKVKLFLEKQEDKEVDMKPGELVDFSAKQKVLVKRAVEAGKYSAWVDNKLVFEETTLKEIAQLLKDNYNYNVTFTQQELEKLTFTGTIDSGNIELLFTILKKTFNISIIKEEANITISNKSI